MIDKSVATPRRKLTSTNLVEIIWSRWYSLKEEHLLVNYPRDVDGFIKEELSFVVRKHCAV